MTEIPEHLLKRSQARRGEGGGDAAAPTASAAPATTDSAAPAVAAKKAAAVPAGPPPAKPDIPVVAAYKARKKIPVWAMITLSILPLWAFLYILALRPEPVKATGPIGAGTKLFAGCSGCHGANGEGGAGRVMQNGALLKTFPHIEDQLNLVYTGSQAFATAGLPYYGDATLAHLGYNGVYMPQQGKKSGGGLTDAEILAVVCHERYDLSGADKAGAYAAEYTLWCAPGSPIYAALVAGSADFDNLADKFKAEGVLPVGTAPRPATPAG